MGGTRRAIGIAAALATGFAPMAARALSSSDLPAAMADGRMLGHLPYPEAQPGDLVLAPSGFAIGQACLVHRDAAPDLARMIAAAATTPGVGRTLRAVSCFRTVAHQRAIFCHGARPGVCVDPAGRARFVGPPGYSEHATGYAIDFGARPSPGCDDVNACIATTSAGRWLLAHASGYGFELSFPPGNAQGVTWEPWHWRWVGMSAAANGAARARSTFARARLVYPGNPHVFDAVTAAPVAPPAVVQTPPAATPPPLEAAPPAQ